MREAHGSTWASVSNDLLDRKHSDRLLCDLSEDPSPFGTRNVAVVRQTRLTAWLGVSAASRQRRLLHGTFNEAK